MWITYEAQGLTRDAEATFQLGTDRAIVPELSERISEKSIEFVPAVPSNPFSKQTRADPQFDTVYRDVRTLL
jgi:hypothetical protein